MNFDIFQRNIDVVRFWRSKNDREDWSFPDSRDPEFQEQMAEAGVVPQDLEKSLAALCAWREGKSEVYQGMSAILHVLYNRQKRGMHRSHLTEVEQFKTMCEPDNPGLTDYPPKDDPNFLKILENEEEILSGKTVDLTQYATVYGRVGGEMDDWFRNIVTSDEFVRCTKIGSITFYRPKDKK